MTRPLRAVDAAGSELGFSRNSRGEPHASVNNIHHALTASKAWEGVLRLNAFDLEVKLAKAPPFPADSHDEAKAQPPPRSVTDTDATKIVQWLERNHGLRVRKDMVCDVVALIADREQFHPVRDYLAGLKWDGVPRIETWLTTYLGVPDSPMARLAGPWWLVQAVKRILVAGAKADYVLVLEGKQGAGKSTLLEALCADPVWFQDSHIDMSGGKDGPIGLRGKWICEFGELASLQRSTVEQTKAFLSRRVDRYRPLFGRYSIDVPRQCVFAATTNDQHYLLDDTGNRRFWPVSVGLIDLEALRRDRDQIWAEAFAWHADDVRHWPTLEEQDLVFTPEQQKRVEVEPWTEKIAGWLEADPTRKVRGVTNTEVCEGCLELKPKDLRRGKNSPSMTVARILAGLGWVRGNDKRYRPPDLFGGTQ